MKIYDASAGTGKTYQLTCNYIVTAILQTFGKNTQISDEDISKINSGFRNILAVTFTNAAAKEMKDRIIEVLQNISENKQDPGTNGYRQDIISAYKTHTGIQLNDTQLQKMCTILLRQILHHYSFFSISTIDSFFQLVLKNLTKELGLPGNFTLELDAKKYEKQAVERLIAKATGDSANTEEQKKLHDWLIKLFEKNIEDGKSWNIEKNLTKFASDAFRNNTVLNKLSNNSSLSINNLVQFETDLKKEIKDFEDEVKRLRDVFIHRCNGLNLKADDFKGKSRSVYVDIDKKILTIFHPNKVDIGKIKTKDCLKEVEGERNALISYIEDNYSTYCTNKIYYNNIYQLGVLNIIAELKDEILRENNVFILDNTPILLSKLNEGDVPFVFEKISQYINSIFIDEFQDTNRSSFANLRLLMDECSQQGGNIFIFGDLKQSIYRFNGGDPSIMQVLIKKNPNSIVSLKDNFRSLQNIVEFNNELFGPMYKDMKIGFVDSKHQRKDAHGIVRYWQVTDKDKDEYDYIKKEIDYYHDEKGYDYSDIVVLIRGNEKIVEIANKLKECKDKDYNPISDIAFKFSSSKCVCKIVEALKYINDKERNISKEIINISDGALSAINKLSYTYTKEKSLLEVVMKIAHILQIDDDTVFLPAFYDAVKAYTSNTNGTIEEFLDYWEETLKDKSVDMRGSKGGVRFSTIHKSKGLAYKVVIVPCSSMIYSKGDVCVDPFRDDSALPFFYASLSEMEKSTFWEYAVGEKDNQYLEAINLLYVAFTRSRDCLSIIVKKPADSTLNADAKNVGTLLCQRMSWITNMQNHLDEDLFVYKDKEDCPKQENNKDTNDSNRIEIDKIDFNDNSITFSTAKEEDLEEFFVDSYDELSIREQGIKYHAFVSKLNTEKDIPNILQANTNKEDNAIIENILQGIISKTQDLHWYDNTYKLMNERAIISFDEDNELVVKRPDRVMYNDNEVIVVDYKFGQAKEEYKNQVKGYIDLISQMTEFGDKKFKGYIFYINAQNPKESRVEQCY